MSTANKCLQPTNFTFSCFSFGLLGRILRMWRLSRRLDRGSEAECRAATFGRNRVRHVAHGEGRLVPREGHLRQSRFERSGNQLES
jgi:hypothetical protein